MKRLVIFALMACSLAVTAQTKQTFQYAQRDSALFLDVWTPANPRPDSACVVALFGGGFVIGNRDDEYLPAYLCKLAESVLDNKEFAKGEKKVPLFPEENLATTR